MGWDTHNKGRDRAEKTALHFRTPGHPCASWVHHIPMHPGYIPSQEVIKPRDGCNTAALAALVICCAAAERPRRPSLHLFWKEGPPCQAGRLGCEPQATRRGARFPIRHSTGKRPSWSLGQINPEVLSGLLVDSHFHLQGPIGPLLIICVVLSLPVGAIALACHFPSGGLPRGPPLCGQCQL